MKALGKFSETYVRYLLVFGLIVLVVSIIVLSLVPPVSKDALVHHLAVPKLYLEHGGIYEIPFMRFSYYPMNLELLYLIPLYFGNDIIPKFIHFSFALLTGLLLFRYLKRRLGSSYALFGVILFLSVPIIVKLSITVYVDLGLIFFSTASLLLILEWVESGFRWRLLGFSALMCGLGLGTKYNGLVTLFLLTLFVPFLYSRYYRGKRAGILGCVVRGVFFLLIALAVFSPWMLRNYHCKHNPLYPLYDRVFNPPKTLQGKHSLQKAGASSPPSLFTYRRVIYHEKWWEIALLPIRIFFQGKDGDPRYFDGKLNPFLFLLPFLAFYKLKEDPEDLRVEKKVIVAYATLFFAFAFFSAGLRIRYISPIIPALVILSVMGIKKIAERVNASGGHSPGTLGVSIAVLVSVSALAYNGRYIAGQFRYVNPFPYIRGYVTRDQYISRYRPEYPAVEYINKYLPQDAKVLFIFLGNRGYYCKRQYLYGGDALYRVFLKAKSGEEIYLGLRKIGVTHLFIYDFLFERWIHDNFPEKNRGPLKEFFREYVKGLYTKKGFSVWALLDSQS